MLSSRSMLCVFKKFIVSRCQSVSSGSDLPVFCLVYLMVPIDLAGALSCFGRLCLLQLLGQILRVRS